MDNSNGNIPKLEDMPILELSDTVGIVLRGSTFSHVDGDIFGQMPSDEISMEVCLEDALDSSLPLISML